MSLFVHSLVDFYYIENCMPFTANHPYSSPQSQNHWSQNFSIFCIYTC